jgi:hypothetical protein
LRHRILGVTALDFLIPSRCTVQIAEFVVSRATVEPRFFGEPALGIELDDPIEPSRRIGKPALGKIGANISSTLEASVGVTTVRGTTVKVGGAGPEGPPETGTFELWAGAAPHPARAAATSRTRKAGR